MQIAVVAVFAMLMFFSIVYVYVYVNNDLIDFMRSFLAMKYKDYIVLFNDSFYINKYDVFEIKLDKKYDVSVAKNIDYLNVDEYRFNLPSRASYEFYYNDNSSFYTVVEIKDGDYVTFWGRAAANNKYYYDVFSNATVAFRPSYFVLRTPAPRAAFENKTCFSMTLPTVNNYYSYSSSVREITTNVYKMFLYAPVPASNAQNRISIFNNTIAVQHVNKELVFALVLFPVPVDVIVNATVFYKVNANTYVSFAFLLDNMTIIEYAGAHTAPRRYIHFYNFTDGYIEAKRNYVNINANNTLHVFNNTRIMVIVAGAASGYSSRITVVFNNFTICTLDFAKNATITRAHTPKIYYVYSNKTMFINFPRQTIVEYDDNVLYIENVAEINAKIKNVDIYVPRNPLFVVMNKLEGIVLKIKNATFEKQTTLTIENTEINLDAGYYDVILYAKREQLQIYRQNNTLYTPFEAAWFVNNKYINTSNKFDCNKYNTHIFAKTIHNGTYYERKINCAPPPPELPSSGSNGVFAIALAGGLALVLIAIIARGS